MLLAVDIGNTNIVLGLIEGDDIRHYWRLGTSYERTGDEYATLIDSLFRQAGLPLSSIAGIAMSCVVPPIQHLFSELLENLFKLQPVVVGPGTKTGMAILYDNPKEVGADRIVNAVAAFQRFKKPCVVVDFGTATTFDVVSADGKYGGGVIAPGIAISAEALFQRASKLPRVDLIAPDRVIGRNTVGSMQSGLYYGYLGLVDRIVEEILREAKLTTVETAIIATGGLAPLLVPASKTIQGVYPHLTLEGLNIIFALNQDKRN